MTPGDTVHIVRTAHGRAYYEGLAVIKAVLMSWNSEAGQCFDCMVRFRDGCVERRRVYTALQHNPKQWIADFNEGERCVPSQAA